MLQTATQTLQLSLRGNCSPTVNGKRLNDTLQHSCQWGATEDGGMNRLALNDDDATVRRWFIQECESLGCKVTVDMMGNIFAVLNGESGAAPIAMGSHLDTQPTGGRYDGILGVLAGLEVLRAVKETRHVTKHPIAVVVWTNEEGARFIPSMLGSAVWAEHHTLEFGHSRQDVDGVTVLDELQRHDMLGATAASHMSMPLKAHFELHIEQGPILYESNVPVTVVSGVQAFRWFDIKLQGRGSHAGTTPMSYRHDPLSAFARMVVAAEQLAKDYGGLATIGRMGSQAPQSTNCILDDVEFHLDIRHHDDAKLDQLEKAIRDRFAAIVTESRGVDMVRFGALTASASTKFDPKAVACVAKACKQWSQSPIISGAGHDSVHTAKRCPTAMVFIRCRDGVSHHPSEYSSPEDITIGARVLLDAILEYDMIVDADI